MTKATKLLIFASAALCAFQAKAWAQKADVGQAEYLSSCGSCHGSDAKGKGPLADQLKVATTDLTQLAKKNGGVFPINAVYEKIDGRQEVKAHGSRVKRHMFQVAGSSTCNLHSSTSNHFIPI